uniref:tRNA wybutosine-synthesizing protein 4 n=1 Tax=Echeneis naucrates TaxID=173247 RepID=A0A665VXN7_ECHNA
ADDRPEERAPGVQGTNDSSVVSKLSAAAQGYFHDAFLQHFVCKVSRRAPLINRGYYVRWRAVDHCVRRFLQITESCCRRQILSLGAGFDSLYFRLRADEALHGVVVLEVDFPDVSRRKAALIGSNVTLRGMLGPHLSPHTGFSQYRLLGVDIREEAQVEAALGAAGLDWAAPTLILSEVVLTYMETQWSDVVISWAAKLLPQSLFVMYEQIRPDDPFGRVMQDHFLKLNSALHALRQYPDSAAHTRRFLDKGWEHCECLDMNDFYLGLIPEEERSRVEILEPFDEYEEWHQKCSHYFILTASRGSFTVQALLTRPAGIFYNLKAWSGSSSCHYPSLSSTSSVNGWPSCFAPPGVRLYHTVTSCPGGGFVVYGGRSSPLNPIRDLFRVTLDPCGPAPDEPEDQELMTMRAERMVCTGDPPPPRWRHTATVVSHNGQNLLLVFGGKSESAAALGDAHFLCLDQQRWMKVPIEGAAPTALHSHSACSFQGGVVVFGGLDRRGVPRGDTAVLRPTDGGFSWDRLEVQPPPVPRYSHSAHMIGEKLVVVGGVWLHSDGVPGVVVIDLSIRTSVEFSLDLTSVPWPLMLHSFCSDLTDSEEPEVVLIGGGGNCFSFGTHFNPQPVTVDLRPALGSKVLKSGT